MTIEEGIFAFLSADADVVAAIGTRIFPLVLPDEPTPSTPRLSAVTYQRTNGTRERAGRGATDCNEASYDFTAWAASYKQAKTVAMTLRSAFDRVHGFMGDVEIREIAADHTRDDYNPILEIYGAVVSLTVQYLEG